MANVIAGDIAAVPGPITFAEISGVSVDPVFPDAGYSLLDLLVPAFNGARADRAEVPFAPVPVVQAGHFLFDFYYRIWVLPETLRAQNPVIGVPIPFAIWNAYPQPPVNALDSITVTNGTGLTFDFGPPDSWRAIELKDVHITIGSTAPLDIDASFEFNFDFGAGLFFFTASIADFVQMIPDPPVQETWAWLTDVIPSRNNTEQRIALRATPRRSIKYGFLLEDETERRRQYRRWYKSMGHKIVLPYYQYHTRLTQASASGSTKLFFDPALTDVRDGEFVIVMDEPTNTGHPVKLETVEADGATTEGPLAFDATTKMIVAPAFTSKLDDRTGLSMQMVTGHIDVTALSLDFRPLFKRPGSTAVIQTYDGLPVLHLRPIAGNDSPETFDANYDVIDSDTGVQDLYVSWPHPVVNMLRRWTIRRRQNPGEMDWWRDFLDAVLGQRDPFLMPTWFSDLIPNGNPPPGAGTIDIVDVDYASAYYPYDTFKRLQIETEAGIVWRKVVQALLNSDGTTTLVLDSPLGPTLADVTINKISYLNRTRLASDTVTLTHDKLRTLISLSTKMVDL